MISQYNIKQKEDSLGITELREQIAALEFEAKFRTGDKDALKSMEGVSSAKGLLEGLTLGGLATTAFHFLGKRRGVPGCLLPILGASLCLVGAIGGTAIGRSAPYLESKYYESQGDKNNQRLNEIQQQIKNLEQEIEKRQKDAGLI